MRFILAALCGLFLACAAHAATLQTIPLGDREFHIYAPDVRGNDVVLIFHGAGGTGVNMPQRTLMNEAADADGFTVVYAESVSGYWNDSNNRPTEDVAYVRDIIAWLKARNADKIFAAGFSNGGAFTQRLACETDLDGYAVVASNLSATLRDMCQPTNEAPMVFFHGTADTQTPFNGGYVGWFANRRYILSSADTLAFWKTENGCSGKLTTNMPNIANDGTTVKRERYTLGCSLTRYIITGGGHTWPGQPTPPPSGNLVSFDINATDLMLRMFGLR